MLLMDEGRRRIIGNYASDSRRTEAGGKLGAPEDRRRRLQKAPASHSFLRDRTETAASPRRAHFPKEAGASGTFSGYWSREKAVYSLTVLPQVWCKLGFVVNLPGWSYLRI
jgi:hypothetical protein